MEDIRENPYYQYLLGLESYQDEAPFEASSLVHFRKRISKDMLCEINEKIVKRMMEIESKDSDGQDGNASASCGRDGDA